MCTRNKDENGNKDIAYNNILIFVNNRETRNHTCYFSTNVAFVGWASDRSPRPIWSNLQSIFKCYNEFFLILWFLPDINWTFSALNQGESTSNGGKTPHWSP